MKRRVLVVDDDEMVVALVQLGLESAGLEVVTAADGDEALARLAEAVPDVVVSDVNMPGMDGLALVARLRSEPAMRTVPLIFLTSRDGAQDVLQGLRLGADDYVRKPFDLAELVARVLLKVERPPVPAENLVRDVRTGVLSESRLREELVAEIVRAAATGRRGGALAMVDVAERSQLVARLGPAVEDELAVQLSRLVTEEAGPLERVARDRDGRFLLLIPEVEVDDVGERLEALARFLAHTGFTVDGEPVHLTPLVGWAPLAAGPHVNAGKLLSRAQTALADAALRLDLHPVRWGAPADAAPAASDERDARVLLLRRSG